MPSRDLAWLCTEGGLEADFAQRLRSEDLTLELLASAKLPERREMLRSLGLRYGQIMAVNRALEQWLALGSDDDDDIDDDNEDDDYEGEDDDDDDGDRNGEAAGDESDGVEGGARAHTAPGGGNGVGPCDAAVMGAGTRAAVGGDCANGSAGIAAVAERVPPRSRQAVDAEVQQAAALLSGASSQTLRGLQVYLGNIAGEPDKIGFRTIQLSNPLFHERVWAVPGGAELLRAAGFVVGPRRTLRLPMEAPLEALLEAKAIVDELYVKAVQAEEAVAEAGEAKSRVLAVPSSPVAQAIHDGAAAAPTSPTPTSPAPETPSPAAAGVGTPSGPAATATRAAAALVEGTPTEESGAKPADGSKLERRRQKLVESMRAIESMVDGAHTQSWDAALASAALIDLNDLSADEIRCCRACNQGRLAALLGRVAHTIWQLSEPRGQTLLQPKSRPRLINALRITSRLMPLLLEETSDAGIQHMLWTLLPESPLADRSAPAAAKPRKTSSRDSADSAASDAEAAAPQAESASSEGNAGACASAATKPAKTTATAAATTAAAAGKPDRGLDKTLGGALIQALLRSLFVANFTLLDERQIDDGLASNPWVSSSATVDEARECAMRALLASCSGSLFISPRAIHTSPDRLLLAAANSPEPHAKALFRALLSVVFSYDPVGWGIPYSHSLLPDSHCAVMHGATLMLIVLLSQPEVPAGGSPDKMSKLLRGLQRPETLSFITKGFARLLRNSYLVQQTYLPHSVVSLECQQELLLLLWKMMALNPAFVAALIASQELHEIVLSLAYLIVAWVPDLPKSSMVHLCMLCLLRISAESDFGGTTNAQVPASFPLSARGRPDSIADILVSCAAKVVLCGEERLECIYSAAFAVLANIAPHVKAFSAEVSELLLQMTEELSSPSFLLGGEGRPELLVALLDVLNSAVVYQHTGNLLLLQEILLRAPVFTALQSITLPPAAPAPASGGEAQAATRSFTPTAAWLEGWKAQLPLQAIMRVIDTLLPKVSGCKMEQAQAVLRSASLAGVLPAPPPVSVRRYQSNEYSEVWLTQVLWGVVYARNQQLFDPTRVRLVQIVQVS